MLVPEDTSVIPDLYVVVIDSYLDLAKVEPIIASQRPMAFLFSQFHDPCNTMQAEIDATVAFRRRLQGNYPCLDYRSLREFEQDLRDIFENMV